MAQDPYNVLGVKNDASQDDIQKAYRALAKKLHPDLNPGNKQAEEQFKDASAAYDLLSDPEKRGRFDRGEIDASGQERPRQRYYRDFAGAGAGAGDHPYASAEGFADLADADDLFSGLFRRGGRGNLKMRGQDTHFRMPVAFLDAVNGATQRITLPDGASLEVTIPAGARDGQLLRLAGKGRPGLGGGPQGDAYIELAIEPHRYFTRKGEDIHLDLPIALHEAVLGSRVSVPTPTGAVSMSVPKGSNTGSVLRLKGKGVPRPDGSRGDQYVTLKIALPEKLDAELEGFAHRWAGKGYNPRRAMEA